MQPFDREYEQRLMDLMMLAVERPAKEWRGLLESACDDAALVEDVLATLSEKDHLGDFLEKPALLKLGELTFADLLAPPEAETRLNPLDSRQPQH